MTDCYRCGSDQHLVRDCPTSWGLPADTPSSPRKTKPVWCGQCDERTRHVTTPSGAARCRVCHPLRHEELPQHRICPDCHHRVYSWDVNQCGYHQEPKHQPK